MLARRSFFSPRGALAFGMVVHELVTNAIKYGALSVPAGKLAVAWDIEPGADGDRIVWRWIEQNGPPAGAGDARIWSVIDRTQSKTRT